MAIDRDELALRLATTLAPMLLGVAVFALTAASLVPTPTGTITDELLSLLAAFCIFSAALLIDSSLDNLQITTIERCTFLNGGYVCFCLVVGSLTAAVPILYSAVQSQFQHEAFGPNRNFLFFGGAGLCVFLKMMTYHDRFNVFFLGMLFFYIWSIYVLA
jgi:hypothetical protein